jgi:tetratricopeptide (TPR) repeat protein
MKMKAISVALSVVFLCTAAEIVMAGGPRDNAEALWAAREDLSKAMESVSAYGSLLKENPKEYETLVRLSRLHYWIGQNLEEKDRQEALSHYGKGRDYGRLAAEAAPDRPGGYFFEGANLARENSLKGTFTNLFGIRTVKKLNEKAASIQAGYFHGGPDRFFCAYYTRLPGLLGGNVSKAIEHGRKAVDSHPAYAGNRLFLAEAYHKDGNDELARRELETALLIPDDALTDSIPEQRMEKKRAAALLKKITH